MSVTSFLVPAGGLLTAPILARALDASGRGELAAALAPGTLMVSMAALGLPDAITYVVARRPAQLRPAVGRAALLSFAAGLLAIALIWLTLPFLAAGVDSLAELVLIAAAIMLPSLTVSLLRGAAFGANRWGLVTAERIATTSIRVGLLGGLWLLGELDVRRAVIVTAGTPVIAGLVYLRLLRSTPGSTRAMSRPANEPPTRLAATLLSYGSQVWLGSISEILLARVSQLLMVPLASTTALGIYVVAVTIADITFILAQAIQSALFGVSSGTSNPDQVTQTSRLALLITFVGAVVLGSTSPFWIGPLFGDQFRAAIFPTLLLLVSSVVTVPSLIASAGVSAWGRPGVRSAGLLGTLGLLVVLFVVLVPTFGAYGACVASIIANVALSAFMVGRASRIMGVPAHQFVIVRRHDVARLLVEARVGYRRLASRRRI